MPSAPSVNVGGTFVLDLQISGLGANEAVGTFDLDVAFDPALTSLSGVTFGTGLDVLGLGSLQFATPGTGTVNLFELSLDDPSDLLSMQPDAFVLATLDFLAVAPGVAPFTLSVNAVGDADGNSLASTLVDTSVEIASPVPEPASSMLLALGLGAIGAASRRRLARSDQLESA